MSMIREMLQKLSRFRKGFTLVELMIVIAIIAILSAILVPQASKMRTNAKLAGVDANIRTTVGIVQAMINEYGSQANLMTALNTKLASTLTNPINSSTGIVICTAAASNSAGTTFQTTFLPNTGTYSAAIMWHNGTTVTTTPTSYPFITKTTSASNPYTDYFFTVDGTSPLSANICFVGTVAVVMYGNKTNSWGNLSGAVVYGFDDSGKPFTSISKSSTAYHIERK